jgi:hypothetical protein
MSIATYATGTHTVSTTEWSLSTNTAGPDVDTNAGVYQAFIDLSALAAGDVFEFAVYEKAISGGTQRKVMVADFAGVQGSPVWVSPSLILVNGWDMTLIKISGTDRSIDFSIRRVS